MLGHGRHVSLNLHHMDPSLRGDTPQFPQPSPKWRTDKLGRMPDLLRQPLQLPPPPHQESTRPVQSPCPIRQRRQGSMCCSDCFDKKIEPRDDWCHPRGHSDCPAGWECFPVSLYGSCSVRKGDQQWRHLCGRTRYWMRTLHDELAHDCLWAEG